MGSVLKFLYRFATPWETAGRSERIKNRILSGLVNHFYSVYCKLTRIESVKHAANRITDEQVVVSLTTFPARIAKVSLCLESILRQTRPADKVILWLADTQFPNKNSLPSDLKSLEGKGLEIRFCEDLKSYKKFFYTAKEYAGSIIIVADDDVFYPEDWVERLLIRHMQHKDCVVCYRAHKITFTADAVAPYSQWLSAAPGATGPAMDLVPTGVGGGTLPGKLF